MSTMELTTVNFDEVITENNLVVIDFWAKWCVPCKSLAKVIETMDKKYPDVIFGSVDIDKEKALAEEFHIVSIPAVMILRDRVIVYAEAGALTVGALGDLIEQTKALDTKELQELKQKNKNEETTQ